MDRWQISASLFEAAADLPPEARKNFLDHACGTDADLRRDVDDLLAADGKAGAGIAAAIESSAQALFATDGVAGARIGSYRVVNEIGRGGMSTVYLAVRDDDQFEKQVAIKLIRRGMDSDDLLRRFREERQILANLEHPYIARLLDGGTASDGRPFLVMEYLQGEPLTAYCQTHDLDLRARCALFLKVCEAVSFAHRNLVVHRDLKPGNILVDANGSPKLLDFGVAKLLDPARGPLATATVASLRPMTPEYASPEQFRGETITTAADVYSLGAILYELLSGARAHRFTSFGLRELERVICDTEPPRASEAATVRRHELQGDLDAIVAKAMRKEPGLRYASVDHLSADIDRYLEGWPVQARQGNLTYRARKFLRRHKLAMTAAALITVALAAGVGATLWQARRTEEQRVLAERRMADANRARELYRQAAVAAKSAQAAAEGDHAEADLQRRRAEQRLADMLDLANRSLFDVHDEIAKLAGATEARKRIAASTLQYLNKLKDQAGNDPRLLMVLSQAYRRLGEVQGDPWHSSLGDTTAALASYREAERLSSRLLTVAPGGDSLAEWWDAAARVASLLSIARMPPPEAFAIWKRAQRLMEAEAAIRPTPVLLANLSEVHQQLAHQLGVAHPAEALPHGLKDVALLEPLVRADPGNTEWAEALSVGYSTVGRIYNNLGRFQDAAAEYRKSIDLDEAVLRRGPDVAVSRDLSIALSDLGNLQYFTDRPSLGDWRASLELYRRASRSREAALAADPADLTVRRDAAFMQMRMGCRMLAPEMMDERRVALESAASVFEDLIAHDPHNRDYSRQLAETMACLGDYWRQAGDPAKALADYGKGEESSKASGVDAPVLRLGRVLALAAAGRTQDAIAAARAAAEQSERNLIDKAPPDPVRIWCVRFWLALAEVLPAGAESCVAVRHAQNAWDGVPAANQVGFARDRESLARHAVDCDN